MKLGDILRRGPGECLGYVLENTAKKSPCNPLAQGVHRVGRGISRDLNWIEVTGDPSVSRNHAEIEVSRNRLILRPLSSTNPSLVNGRVVLRPVDLFHGDTLTFGSTDFAVRSLEVANRLRLPPPPWGDVCFCDRIRDGGMASVYKGVFKGKTCALKLPRRFGGDPAFTKSVITEAAIGTHLTHPNIVETLGLTFLGDGTPCQVTRLYEDGDLDRFCHSRGGKLSENEVSKIGIELADAVSAVHKLGVVHCDIKPENILIDRGTMRLSDFGVATVPGQAVAPGFMSGPYASPEQLTGRGVGYRSDLFMIGQCLARLLTGHVPAAGSDIRGSGALVAYLNTLRATQPFDRPTSAKDVAVTIRSLAQG